jgi:hypothetical protein
MVQILGVSLFVVPLVAVLEHIAIAKAFGKLALTLPSVRILRHLKP